MPPAFARRLRTMYDHLVECFGPQQWWPAKTPFEVVIGAYLTQNTAWKSVERSIGNLDARGVLSIDGLRAIPEHDLRDLIRPSGFMLRKATALKAFVAFLDARCGGKMETLRREALDNPHTVRDQLLALLSVGPETADAILLYALGAPAMVVDEYLRRVVVRHGLAHENAKYEQSSLSPSKLSRPSPPARLRTPQPSPAITTNSTPSSSRSANLTVAAWPAARAVLFTVTRTKIPPHRGPPHKMKP